MNEKKETLFTLLTIFMTVLWGTSFAFTNIVLNDGVSPFQILAIRFILSAILLSLVFIKSLKHFTKDELLIGIKSGVALFFGMAFQVFGIKYTSASNAAFLTMLYVIEVPLISVIFKKHKLNSRIILSAILALIGIAFVSLQNGFTKFNIGDLLTIICSIFIAIQMIVLDEKNIKFDSLRVTIVEMGVVGILSLIAIPLFQGGAPIPKTSILPLAYLAFIPGCLCFTLQTVCQKQLPVHKVTILFTFESIFATVANVILLHETISILQVVGFIAIFLATLVIVLPQKSKK